MQEIKRVGVLQVAIWGGLLSLLTSLVGEVLMVFPFLASGGRFAPLRGGVPFSGPSTFPVLLAWVVLFAPILYGALGFLVTGMCCWFYNLFAPKIGGIEVQLEDR
jgi:hypothetical protein